MVQEANTKTPQPVLLEDGLQAGFLYSLQGTRKHYMGFKRELIENAIEWMRYCTKEEKARLNSMVFGKQCVKSMRGSSKDGREVCLFFHKASSSKGV